MKYLIMEDFSGQEVPFIFPRRVEHEDMRDQLPYSKVVSCGYLEMDSTGLYCSGGNVELSCMARPQEDASIIIESLRRR